MHMVVLGLYFVAPSILSCRDIAIWLQLQELEHILMPKFDDGPNML